MKYLLLGHGKNHIVPDGLFTINDVLNGNIKTLDINHTTDPDYTFDILKELNKNSLKIMGTYDLIIPINFNFGFNSNFIQKVAAASAMTKNYRSEYIDIMSVYFKTVKNTNKRIEYFEKRKKDIFSKYDERLFDYEKINIEYYRNISNLLNSGGIAVQKYTKLTVMLILDKPLSLITDDSFDEIPIILDNFFKKHSIKLKTLSNEYLLSIEEELHIDYGNRYFEDTYEDEIEMFGSKGPSGSLDPPFYELYRDPNTKHDLNSKTILLSSTK